MKSKGIVSTLRTLNTMDLRVLLFILISLLLSPLHRALTRAFYDYEILVSDGFVFMVPYIILAGAYALGPMRTYSPPKIKLSSDLLATMILALIAAFLPAGFFGLKNYLDIIFFEFALLLVAHILIALVLFGAHFFRSYLSHLLVVLLLIAILKITPLLTDYFWEYSSRVTMAGLSILTAILPIDALIVPSDFRVQVGSFNAFIGPPCAGIHSLSAFTVLYLASVYLTGLHYELRAYNTILVLIVGLLSVFFLNSVRVLAIILFGAHISGTRALDMFHNNVGAVFLIIFFIIYISFTTKFIQGKQKI